MKHQITRHRHEAKRRRLTVREKTGLTPNMIRILFDGNDLADFISLAPDDQALNRRATLEHAGRIYLPDGGRIGAAVRICGN